MMTLRKFSAEPSTIPISIEPEFDLTKKEYENYE